VEYLREDEVTDLKPISAEAQMILAELHSLRDEMASMHQETRATLTAIRELFNELRQVESTESSIEQELESVANRLGEALDDQQISLTSCSVCGSDVERHVAENGILLICKACGHTAFADRRAIGDRRAGSDRRNLSHSATEGPPDLDDGDFDWTTRDEA